MKGNYQVLIASSSKPASIVRMLSKNGVPRDKYVICSRLSRIIEYAEKGRYQHFILHLKYEPGKVDRVLQDISPNEIKRKAPDITMYIYYYLTAFDDEGKQIKSYCEEMALAI